MPAEHLDQLERTPSPRRLASQLRSCGPAATAAAPSTGAGVGPAPDLRVATSDGLAQPGSAAERRVAELEAEIAHLRLGLETRTRIALANGLLAERFGCSPAQAWSLLERLSSHTNLKLRRVADLVVAEVEGSVPTEGRSDLARLAGQVPGLFGDRQATADA